MNKNEIIKKTLENLNVQASESSVFLFETLLASDETKRVDLINMLHEKYKHTDSEGNNLLKTLNQNNIVKWEVIKGVARVRLTKQAKKEFAIVYVSYTGEEYQETLQKMFSSGKKEFNNLVDHFMEEGKILGKRLRKEVSKTFFSWASKLDNKD